MPERVLHPDTVADIESALRDQELTVGWGTTPEFEVILVGRKGMPDNVSFTLHVKGTDYDVTIKERD